MCILITYSFHRIEKFGSLEQDKVHNFQARGSQLADLDIVRLHSNASLYAIQIPHAATVLWENIPGKLTLNRFSNKRNKE